MPPFFFTSSVIKGHTSPEEPLSSINSIISEIRNNSRPPGVPDRSEPRGANRILPAESPAQRPRRWWWEQRRRRRQGHRWRQRRWRRRWGRRRRRGRRRGRGGGRRGGGVGALDAATATAVAATVVAPATAAAAVVVAARPCLCPLRFAKSRRRRSM